MKKDGKYRFNLQFPAETEEQIQVGELLERLGNRKSAVVVAALSEYLLAHSELRNPECKVEIKAAQAVRSSQLQEMIERMLDERLGITTQPFSERQGDVGISGDISEMLDNIDNFQ